MLAAFGLSQLAGTEDTTADIAGAGLRIAIHIDPVLGPILGLGLIGELPEALDDCANAPLPVPRTLVATLLPSLKCWPALARGCDDADIRATSVVVEQLSEAALMLQGQVDHIELDITKAPFQAHFLTKLGPKNPGQVRFRGSRKNFRRGNRPDGGQRKRMAPFRGRC